MPKLSIVIPAYNEAKTLEVLVEKILKVSFPIDFEVIIVDDHSSDRTFAIAEMLDRTDEKKRIHALRNETNRGKGYSIRRGLAKASGDIVVVQDADFEYEPKEIPRLLEPILDGRVEAVYGSRFLFASRPEGMAFANYVANRFLTWMTNVLYGATITDMETCYKLIRTPLIRSLELKAERFDFEPEITTALLKKKIKILELPIPYRGRSAGEGKKIKARDFFIALWVLWHQKFKK